MNKKFLVPFFCIFFGFLSAFADNNVEHKSNYKYEVRTAPVALIAHWITLDASYFINENWALGPSVIDYANPSTQGGMFLPTFNGYAVGGHLIWAENLLSDGYYISSHIYYEDYKSYPEAFFGYRQHVGTRYNAVLGKRWISGNCATMLGLGYENIFHTVTVFPDGASSYDDSENASSGGLTIEFKMGLLF